MIYMYLNWLFYIFACYNKHCFKDKNVVSLKKCKCHITVHSYLLQQQWPPHYNSHFPLSPRWPLWRHWLQLDQFMFSLQTSIIKCYLYHTFSKGIKNMENKVVCVRGKKVQVVLLQNSTGCHTSWVRFHLDTWQINFNERTVSNTRLALR